MQDIYDEFSGGQVAAEAIRSFLAYAYSNWQPPAPAYVLLLGDGTFDPRGYCASPVPVRNSSPPPNSTLIPPYLAAVDPWLGETAADNRFVALDRGSSLPWLAIGRLPANDAAEAQAMVDKILAYEANLPAQADARTIDIALVSDNAYAANGTLDPAGNFWQASDAALSVLHASGRRQWRAAGGGAVLPQYLRDGTLSPLPPAGSALPPVRRCAQLSLRHWQAGWPRHPGPALPACCSTMWATVRSRAGPGSRALLQSCDVAGLGLAPRLPVVLDMTCYTGYFHFPGLQSMAEAWLAVPAARRRGGHRLQRPGSGRGARCL